MKKEFEFALKGYTGDAVIKRGYAIYDEWEENKQSSQKIVAQVERAVSAMGKKKKRAATLEALAFLFALDLRIKEKYNTLLQCLLSYFSRKREVRALKLLMNAFHISDEETDLRTVIEVELQKLREKIVAGEEEEDDDETHGGRRNGKAEEDAVTAEKKGNEQSAEEKADETPDAEESKEASEEKNEEKTTDDNQKTESGEQRETADNQQENIENTVQDSKDTPQNEQSELKEENNVSGEKSETRTDKSKETNNYNYTDYVPPVAEEKQQSKSAETLSFIDEVILDNMVKGKKDFITHDPLDDIRQERESVQTENTITDRNVEGKAEGKEDFLYDEMMANNKENVPNETDRSEQPQTEQSKPEQSKVEQAKDQPQTDANAAAIKQEFESTRVPIQVDMTTEVENDMKNVLHAGLTPEMILAIKAGKEMEAREQLRLEFGDDEAALNIVGKTELADIKPPVAAPNRK